MTPKGLYEHTNGCRYVVLMITNEHSVDHKRYPPTVVYVGVVNGRIWSRPLSDWDRSFKKVDV